MKRISLSATIPETVDLEWIKTTFAENSNIGARVSSALYLTEETGIINSIPETFDSSSEIKKYFLDTGLLFIFNTSTDSIATYDLLETQAEASIEWEEISYPQAQQVSNYKGENSHLIEINDGELSMIVYGDKNETTRIVSCDSDILKVGDAIYHLTDDGLFEIPKTGTVYPGFIYRPNLYTSISMSKQEITDNGMRYIILGIPSESAIVEVY